jgi:glycosyltransferase involved in cell wall biosynthesis
MRAREAGGGPCRLLFLGRVGVRKGVADLLQALASPVLAAHSWHIDLAGDGDIEAYADRARALGLQDRVRFHGWTDPAPLLARADILVLPSRNEGLPVAIIEAMAHGLPVVATPVGAIEEAVRHEQTGLIVPPRNPGALAAALARLIADPALRHRLGAAGRERYLAEFEIGAFNDRLQAMLAQVIAARGGRFPEAA